MTRFYPIAGERSEEESPVDADKKVDEERSVKGGCNLHSTILRPQTLRYIWCTTDQANNLRALLLTHHQMDEKNVLRVISDSTWSLALQVRTIYSMEEKSFQKVLRGTDDAPKVCDNVNLCLYNVWWS